MEVKEKIILPEKYYHTYFLDLVEFVRRHSAHLMGEDCLGFIASFEALSEDAQCLFLRFSNRKGPFFRLDKLHYEEIDLVPATAELLEKGFITKDFCAEPRLLKLFTKQELLSAFDVPGEWKGLYKEHLIITLFENVDLKVLMDQYGIIQVDKEDPFEFVKMLYFGHYRGQMTEFVIRDVGNIKLEPLNDDQFNPWFETHEEASALFRISKLSGLIRRALKSCIASEIVPVLEGVDFDPYTRFPKSQKVLDRILLELGLQLEREEMAELALRYYRFVRKPPSRERQIRIYNQLGENEKANQMAEEILTDYRNASELLFAKDYISRPKVRINRSTTSKEKEAGVLQLTPCEERNVERLVLEHFQSQGFRGIHCENFLWRNLFGLFFWEELFDQSYDNFHHPLQRTSSDLYDPVFYERRKDQLHRKISTYNSTDLLIQKVLTTFEEKKGINNPLTYWFEDFPTLIREGVQLLPYTGLSNILLEMSKNVKDNSKGFPDLFLWRDREYQFYEVKSPNDHLSSQQLFWIDFMEKQEMNVEILRITY